MLLEDLYQRLSYGELSNLSISTDGNGSIIESAQPRVVLYANEALVRLYSTFILRTNSLLITPIDHITYYHLKKRLPSLNVVHLTKTSITSKIWMMSRLQKMS